MNAFLISYIGASLLIGVLHFVNRNALVSRSLIALFVALQCWLTVEVLSHGGMTVNHFFTFDGLASLLTIVVTTVSTAAFCHSRRYIEEEESKKDAVARAQYYGAMTLLTMALTMAGLSNHVAMTWIFIEVTTLSASALIFYRRNAGSIEATWKYVFACSISLVLVYVGILLLTVSMGAEAEEGLSFHVLMSKASSLDSLWLKLSFIFILVGYTAKMGLVPMFTAGIDAKDKAPTPAAAMLSSVVMNAGFVGFYRVYAVIAHTEAAHWAQMVVLGTGLVSVFVAAVYLVRVQNVKRLFAYSSVEHMGVVMIGIAAGGVGTYAAILHLVLHAFAKSAVFMHIGQLYRVFGTKNLSKMGSYATYSGAGTAFVLLALLCVTAMPPSGLFMTELMIFKSVIDTQWWAALVLLMIILCIIVWAISRDMLSLLFLPAKSSTDVKAHEAKYPIAEALWQFALIALSIWWAFFTPDTISEFIRQSAGLLQ